MKKILVLLFFSYSLVASASQSPVYPPGKTAGQPSVGQTAIHVAAHALAQTTAQAAGQTDTILVHSDVMHKDIKVVIIHPEKVPAKWSVVYLLHGYSGNYAQWPQLAPQLPQRSNEDNILFVCPDGGFDSWYFDSPIDPAVRYETFMTKELIPYIDSHYPTQANREHRAITGLSMGGHGGLFLGFHHKDLFGACGATSGGVDIRPFPDNWGIKKDLGTITDHKENWDKYTVSTIADSLHNGDQKIIFDCGVNDFFLTVNRALHQKLCTMKIDHDYTERPGGHNSTYWNNSIDYQILFFHKYFSK